MHLSDFDYQLPEELIAQFPLPDRTQSRLLRLNGVTGEFTDQHFADLPELVRSGDLLVFNDTKVIKARLLGHKDSGGRVEVLIERVLSDAEAIAQVRASHAPKPGSRLRLADAISVQVLQRQDDLFLLRFENSASVFELLDQFGTVPLPPYITHSPDAQDEVRYQTVYARLPGAVAAPTAGLHFNDAMLEKLRKNNIRMAYVTLHVGAGTFQPVRVEDLALHRMHSEWYQIPEATATAISETRSGGGRVIAVGTTTLRALESAANDSGDIPAGCGDTTLFITPGYRFRVVDRLLTNFHLPKSTLLMLVSAFGGSENVRHAYRHAVETHYRFFSYGDAMLIERQELAPVNL
jgi:S-adenosylmethionine:tRNA ribosyltransferase-isomerase